MGAVGEIWSPAAGMLASTGELDGGNQLTCVGAPTRSHGRGAAAISVAPVAAWRPSEIDRCGSVPNVRRVRPWGPP